MYRQRRKVAARPLVQALQRLVGLAQGEAGQAVGKQGVDEGLVEAGANDNCLCVAAMAAVSIATTSCVPAVGCYKPTTPGTEHASYGYLPCCKVVFDRKCV